MKKLRVVMTLVEFLIPMWAHKPPEAVYKLLVSDPYFIQAKSCILSSVHTSVHPATKKKKIK